MWTWRQKDGLMLHDGRALVSGYAGAGEGKNNPAMQNVAKIGPLPVGHYTITEPHDSPRTGKYTMNLIPDAHNEMFGRSDFRVHGDSIDKPGTASEGCIVIDHWSREQVWQSGDHELEVIA
jgi:hypothetical protein